MSDNPNRPEAGNEADESADARLLFARILERLDRLEKKLDSSLANNNRPRQPWSNDNRRPGGTFNRPFKSNGFAPRPNGFAPRPGGPNRFEGGSRGPGGPGRFDGPRGPRPHQGGKPFGNRPQSPR